MKRKLTQKQLRYLFATKFKGQGKVDRIYGGVVATIGGVALTALYLKSHPQLVSKILSLGGKAKKVSMVAKGDLRPGKTQVIKLPEMASRKKAITDKVLADKLAEHFVKPLNKSIEQSIIKAKGKEHLKLYKEYIGLDNAGNVLNFPSKAFDNRATRLLISAVDTKPKRLILGASVGTSLYYSGRAGARRIFAPKKKKKEG